MPPRIVEENKTMDKLRGIILDELTYLRRADNQIGIIIPASPFDTYRVDNRWFSANSFYTWTHDTSVDAIHFCQSYHFEIGQPFEVHSPLEQYSNYLEIQGIKMISAAQLADDDLMLLGYSCRADYEQQQGRYDCMDNGWLIWGRKIEHIGAWLGPDAETCRRVLLEIALHSPAVGHVKAHDLGAVSMISQPAVTSNSAFVPALA
jgi:hypothetical protein